MIKLLEKLLNLIYIQPCYFCRSTKEDKILCSKCYKKIHFMPESVFKVINGCNVYACCLYDGIIKSLIRDLKYHKKKKLAKLQAQLMYEYWQELHKSSDFIIVPVPIHKNRLKERKYNHMDLIAEEFSLLTNYKINKNLILRIKDTQKQFNLKKAERIKNIKGAFVVNEEEILEKSQKILIIDDITSTGITLEEVIKPLKKAGYKNITALTLATPDIWN